MQLSHESHSTPETLTHERDFHAMSDLPNRSRENPIPSESDAQTTRKTTPESTSETTPETTRLAEPPGPLPNRERPTRRPLATRPV